MGLLLLAGVALVILYQNYRLRGENEYWRGRAHALEKNLDYMRDAFESADNRLWEAMKFIGAISANEKGIPPTLQDPEEDNVGRSFVMDDRYDVMVEEARKRSQGDP